MAFRLMSYLLAGASVLWSLGSSAKASADVDASGLVSEAEQASSAEVVDRVTVQGEQYLSVNESQSVKTPTPIIDVPQSLSLITAEEITARGFDSVEQIIQYTPGVNTSQGEGHRDAVVFRGVRSTADFFVDGNRDDVQYYRPLYNVEKVEILRGPNALLFGRGGTGGILNRVTKKPQLDQAFLDYNAGIDTFGGYATRFDGNVSTGPQSALRVNAMVASVDNHRDFYDGDRVGLNPKFRYALSESTTFDVSYEYIDHERFIDRGIPTAGGRPVEALQDIVFGDPDNNFHELTAHVVRANAEHLFSDRVKGNINVFYGDYDKVYANFYATDYDAATQVVELDGYIDDTLRQNLIVSGNLIAEVMTGEVEHTLIAGVEFIDTASDQSRFNPEFSTSQADRESLITTRPLALAGGRGVNADGASFQVGFSDFNDDTSVDLSVTSLFIQDEIQLNDHLDLVLGARFDRFDIEVFDNDPAVLSARTRVDEEITPRGGLIVKPQENVSLYLSYSESFLPRSGEQYANINGAKQALDPDTFTNQELGVKWDVTDRLSLSAAVFKNEQSSPQVADADPSTLDVIDAEIDGMEFQLSGALTERLVITANYSQLNGEIVERTGPTGRTPRELPETMGSVWARLDASDAFGVGLGVTYQGRSFINSANTAFLPSYTRFDAALYYTVSDRLRLQLNLENLTDKLYFPHAHATHQASVGEPRQATLSVMGSF